VQSTSWRGARALALLMGIAVAACVTPYRQGERLYRQGDLRGALEAWRSAGDRAGPRIRERMAEVEAELDRLLLRYEKRAQVFESEDRLAEAVLYYRLALKLDPGQEAVLDRVQELVRLQQERVRADREAMRSALAEGRMDDAAGLANDLARLDPFDPAIQIELRQARASLGGALQRHLEAGKDSFAAGNREGARRAFEAALEIEERNETALGYLSYLRRFEESEGLPGGASPPPPPATISEEQILAEGHFRAAEQAESIGEPYRAIVEYQATLRIDPKHARARSRLEVVRDGLRPRIEDLYEIGKRYFQDEDLHNAARVWRQVLLIDPGDQRTRENVERTERMLSRLEEIQSRGP
jgi:tetratricopeptide (TPR) repeat protein